MKNNKVKKVLLLVFVLMFALNGLCFAAKSSSRPASRPSAPAKSAPTTQTTPSTGYKPSAPANSYNEKAPATKQAAAAQTAQPSTGSSWMRNVGMFAGGMMLGGFLSNMFGYGHSGMFADILGMLFSLVPLLGIFLLGRFLWTRYKAKRDKESSNY